MLAEAMKQDAAGNTSSTEQVVEAPETTAGSVDPIAEVVTQQVAGDTVPKAEYDRLNAAHKTLQQKYNAEIPSLMHIKDSDLPRLTQRLDALETENESLKAKLIAQVQPEKPAHMQFVKDEELADLNPSAVDVSARMARGEAKAEADKVRKDLIPTLEQIQHDLAEARASALWSEVEKVHPGAEAMNKSDANWTSFLKGTDELSGLSFQTIGERAMGRRDAKSIISLISRYKAAANGSDTTQAPQGDERVLSQVKPAAARAAQSTKGSTKPTYTESQWSKFRLDVSKGKYNKNPDLEAKLSNQFCEAALEGRIIPG